MRAAFADRHGVGVADGVLTVTACQSGADPLDVDLSDDAPTHRASGAARFHLDVPTGRLALQDNGDAAVQSVIQVPPGRYHARLAVSGARGDCSEQRFELVIWPR